MHRFGNILEGLRPHIIADNLNFATDLPVGVIGHANPARFADALKAGGNVDTIPEDIVVVDDDVPDVDADPQFDPLILRHRRILLGHFTLDFNGTAHRIHGTGKFDQHTVARGLDDPPAMLGNGGVNESLPDRLQAGQRALLIDAHQAAVSSDVCRQHRCQSPLYVVAGQKKGTP